jgi:hypothetical protein
MHDRRYMARGKKLPVNKIKSLQMCPLKILYIYNYKPQITQNIIRQKKQISIVLRRNGPRHKPKKKKKKNDVCFVC